MHLSESHLEAGTTEPADVAPNEPPIGVRWLREKPAPKTTEHGQPLPTYIGVRAKRNDFIYIAIDSMLLYLWSMKLQTLSKALRQRS
jgi:hypothetical protein